jgi:hypothetical protein
MRSEDMRRDRRLWLATHKKGGSSFAFDALGEVKDPIAHILKWANENLSDDEIKRLQTELASICEDSDGLRPLGRQAGDTESAEPFSREGPVFTEGKRKLNHGAAADRALAFDSADSSYEALFSDTKRLDRRPISWLETR